MSSKFKIAGLQIEPGTKRRGYLRVGPYFHLKMHIRHYILIPFTVIRGAQDGPILVQTAGCHPTEYAGIDATIKLSNVIRPEELKGTLVGVPCVNIPGFWERMYINPLDEKNIQEVYPGKTDGTISDLMAYMLLNEIVSKANYYLDCHGGDIHESVIWSFSYYKTDDEIEKKSQEIAKATGMTYLRRIGNTHPSMGMEATKRGIPGGGYEINAGDRLLSEESSAIFEGTCNVMRYLGMLEGSPKPIRTPGTTEGQKQEILTSNVTNYFTTGGLYHTDMKPGDLVVEGQVVGTVTDFWGEMVETIRAPATGRVHLMMHNPVVKPGDSAVWVWKDDLLKPIK
jgi:predicted deacylase